MSLYSGNLSPIFDELMKQFQNVDVKLKDNPYMVILDRLGRKYLIHSMPLKECIKDNHLIFTAYYRDSELTSHENPIYSVALPVDLYSGIELHASLPKDLEDEYKSKDYRFSP